MNWIKQSTGNPLPSLNDKVKALFEIRFKLVLCQQHEVERLKAKNKKEKFAEYIDNLYDHYIIKQLPKTYLV
jgi:hypothetical protein